MPKSSDVFRLRLDPDLKRKALKAAKLEQRTLASLIRLLLDQYLGKKATS